MCTWSCQFQLWLLFVVVQVVFSGYNMQNIQEKVNNNNNKKTADIAEVLNMQVKQMENGRFAEK